MAINTNPQGLLSYEDLLARAETIYDEVTPPIVANQVIAPTGGEYNGARYIQKAVLSFSGEAAIIGERVDDLPLINAGAIYDEYPVAWIGCSYDWSLQEVRGGQFAGVAVSDYKNRGARLAIERMLDKVFFKGALDLGVYGVASFPLIPRVQLNPADFAPGADPEDTLAALYQLVSTPSNLTNGAFAPDTLLLPPAVYNYVASTQASSMLPDTILQVFERNAQYGKRVIMAPHLADAGPAGGPIIAVLSTQYQRGEHIVPNPLEILPEQPRNLRVVVNVVAQTAGFITEYPYAHAIGEL